MKKIFSGLFLFMIYCFLGATPTVANNHTTGSSLEKRDYINETARRIGQWEERIASLRVQRDNELRTSIRFMVLDTAIARMETGLYSAERSLNDLRGSASKSWSHYQAVIEDSLATVRSASSSVQAE